MHQHTIKKAYTLNKQTNRRIHTITNALMNDANTCTHTHTRKRTRVHVTSQNANTLSNGANGLISYGDMIIIHK